MKHRSKILRVGVALGLVLAQCFVPLHAAAGVPAPPSLFIREVKITGDEFVVLQATSDIADLSQYWLGYTSSDTAANVVPTQQLPAQKLAAGQAILLTSDGAATCDAVLTNKLSATLSDTKGTLVVRQLQNTGKTSTFTTIDSVNWNKSTSSVKTSDPIDLSKEVNLNYPVWYHGLTGVDVWQVGDFADCTLTFAGGTSAQGATNVVWPQNDTDPPATIESLAADDTQINGPVLPASDVGLLPPQITELLPNPAGTGNDATDEFIELYNPNAATFDLSGFVLQTGLTTKHGYTFPAGTSLPPKSFVAFYSADTGLSLSNTSGQADLEDPFATVISQADSYGTAKDGAVWALAKGTWYWTSQATPNAANVINQTATSGSGIKTTSAKKAAAAVKGASTAKSPLQSSAGTKTAADITPAAPIHPLVLAAVAVLAVGYGIYEYRHDLANRLHQFRSNRAARRGGGE